MDRLKSLPLLQAVQEYHHEHPRQANPVPKERFNLILYVY